MTTLGTSSVSTTASLLHHIYSSQYALRQTLTTPFGERCLTYADYVASGQSLSFIEDYIDRVVRPAYANTHTEASFTGRQSTYFREEARAIIKAAVNAGDDDVVIFCGTGSTGAIDLLFRQLVRTYATTEPKPVVLIGPFEHHSNILPWRESGFEVAQIPLCPNGNVDLTYLETQLRTYVGTRPIIGSFSAASNVTGIIAPVEAITRLLHHYGALSLWDYAAAAPYVPIDMNPNGVQGGLGNKDAVFISTHKFIGGPGTPGILVAKKHLFTQAVPSVPGGGTVAFVNRTEHRYLADVEHREEAGTPDVLGAVRAGLVFKLKETVGVATIERRERTYIRRAIEQLGTHPNIHLMGNLTADRLGFVAFNVEWQGRLLHHNYVVTLLNDLFGIQVRGGCSCAGPYGMDLLDIDDQKGLTYQCEVEAGNVAYKPGWVRLSVNYFIPEAEFQYILNAVTWVAEHGWKLLKQYTFNDGTALWHHRQTTVPLRSLHDFLRDEVSQAAITNRPTAWATYLQEADALAQTALDAWDDTPTQTYAHTQVDSPRRWYALADDAIVAERV